MSRTGPDCCVAIIGAGPVGLFLAISLRTAGIDCIVLEQRRERIRHSRSIGIHPVSLEAFSPYELNEGLLKDGVKIRAGHAFLDRKAVGTIDFSACPKPFNFILSCPQYITESVLEARLESLAPTCLRRGVCVNRIEVNAGAVVVRWQSAAGRQQRLTAKFLVGCDGWHGVTRHAMGCRVRGGEYPDFYLMGDFPDATQQRDSASIFLHRSGLVESFPLPAGRRRWVVKTGAIHEQDQHRVLVQKLAERTGIDLSGLSPSMLSAFGVQHYLAHPMQRGNMFLAGDAAHVISPIGGQGMNLGWLDAQHLANVLINQQQGVRRRSLAPRIYAQKRDAMAKKAMRRAEFNMALGRCYRWRIWRQVLLYCMLNTPLRSRMARLFSMRGLASGLRT